MLSTPFAKLFKLNFALHGFLVFARVIIPALTNRAFKPY